MRSSRFLAPAFLLLAVLAASLFLQGSEVQKPALPNIRIAAYFTGANAGARIAACIADLPATGGICDARGIEGAQSASATITIPANVQLLLGAVTLSSSANPVIDITGNGASIIGISYDTGGTEISNTGVGTTLRIGTAVVIRNLLVESLHLEGNGTAGIGISASVAGDMVIEKLRIVNHLNDSIRIDDGIHIAIKDSRIIADAARLAGAFGINIGPSNPNTTTVRITNCYIAGYATLLRNNGAATTSESTIYESATDGVNTSSNGFVSIRDAFEAITGSKYVLASNAIASIYTPFGITSLTDIDHTGIVDKTRIHIILPIGGASFAQLFPFASGNDLGSSSLRWDVFGVTGDFSTTLTAGGVSRFEANDSEVLLGTNLSRLRIFSGVTAARVNIGTSTAASIGLILHGTGVQTGDLQQWRAANETTVLANISAGGTLDSNRLRASLSTALVAGDFALSAGWGATATIGTITGTDQRFRATITSAGAGQAANPTVTLTFTDGTWTTAPFFTCSRGGGSQPTVQFEITTLAATTLLLTFQGTPIAAETYVFSCVGMG